MELNWFKQCLSNKTLVNKIKKIKLVVFDVDGTLTDNCIYLLEGMEQTKGYNIQDGYAIHHAIEAEMDVAFLTGKDGRLVEERANKLGVPKNRQYMGYSNDKHEAIKEMQQDGGYSKDEILMFGDDVLDVGVKDIVGMFACPENAVFYVKHKADLIVPKLGGDGAARLLLDLVLYVQGRHFTQELIDDALKA